MQYFCNSSTVWKDLKPIIISGGGGDGSSCIHWKSEKILKELCSMQLVTLLRTMSHLPWYISQSSLSHRHHVKNSVSIFVSISAECPAGDSLPTLNQCFNIHLHLCPLITFCNTSCSVFRWHWFTLFFWKHSQPSVAFQCTVSLNYSSKCQNILRYQWTSTSLAATLPDCHHLSCLFHLQILLCSAACIQLALCNCAFLWTVLTYFCILIVLINIT